jgi:hypothetical protein
MKKKTAKKKPAKKLRRKPRPDFSQQSLSAVERVIGGKLSQGMRATKPAV